MGGRIRLPYICVKQTQINMNSLFYTDGYKTGHHQQYPLGTEEVYSNWTARSNRYAPEGIEKVLSFGQQWAITQLHEQFQTNFFQRPKKEVCKEMKEELSLYLNQDYEVSHFEELHDLGYLPIRVKAITEGEEVDFRIPLLSIVNTKKEFYWITNYLETALSALLWQPMTSASLALLYRRILFDWARKTDPYNIEFIDFQGHDFSMRGMGGIEAATASGMGHAAVFKGSDTLPVIPAMRKYYGAKGFVIGSVNATEHSVMCAGSEEGELQTFKRLLRTYPEGILSIVSDTWDLWRVLEDYLPKLKQDILSRPGKLVLRPDSGNPADILCGTQAEIGANLAVEKGVIEILWDLFGGQINNAGYRVLNPKIGAIYGDSISPEIAEDICKRLAAKGFASTNVVLGIGSFTYQFKTRDTFGFAMKATSVKVNGVRRSIFKNPVTDNGIKRSAFGLLRVEKGKNGYKMLQNVSEEMEQGGELRLIYEDGNFFNRTSLEEIRDRINHQIEKENVRLEKV